MRKVAVFVLAIGLMGMAYADLQNVTVGGELRIRGRWWDDWNDTGLKYVEQLTALHVNADFTDNVSAFIQFHSYNRWGEDFRSSYLTGLDSRPSDDVAIHQAYINVEELFGAPIRLRVGRQELTFAKAWLLGSQTSPTMWYSYDALRLTYKEGKFTLDGWMSKLAENSPNEEDGDVDYYGLYATYNACDWFNVSPYWVYIRDGRTPGVSHLHTPALRVWGAGSGVDYNVELAYQFGESEQASAIFKHDLDYNAFAGDVEMGYTFDANCKPRVFVGGAYFGGEDNPNTDDDLSFNRLFSGQWYSSILDIRDGASAMTNFWQVRGGLSANATKAISTGLSLAYFGIVDAIDNADDGIGTMSHVWVRYQYSADLWVRIGWEHLFKEDGLTDGNWIFHNGLSRPTLNDRDADYLYFDTQVKF